MKREYEWIQSISGLQREISSDANMVWDALIEGDYRRAIRAAHDLKIQACGVVRIGDYLEREATYEMGVQASRRKNGKSSYF